jgi:hypothetical protein
LEEFQLRVAGISNKQPMNRRGCYVIDMNPRIGGGYPFAHIAGANLPAALIAWASGQPPDPAWFNIEPNIAASRCDGLLITNRKLPETARSARRTKHLETLSKSINMTGPEPDPLVRSAG